MSLDQSNKWVFKECKLESSWLLLSLWNTVGMEVGYTLWLVRDTDNYTGCYFSQYKAQGGLAHRENACQGLHSFCPGKSMVTWTRKKEMLSWGTFDQGQAVFWSHWLVGSWNWCATSVIGYKLWSTYQSWKLYSQESIAAVDDEMALRNGIDLI